MAPHPSVCIACANLKGGVGKTTLAVLVARHLDALLVDLDPQGDASDWATRSGLVRVRHLPDPRAAIAAIRAEPGAVVVDCPPGDGPALRAALSVAGWLVIPTRAGAQDLRAVGRMLHLAEEARSAGNPGLRLSLVLNEPTPQAIAAAETEAALKKTKGLSYIGSLRRRQAIADAYAAGSTIPSGPARDEAETLLASLDRIMRRNA